MDSGSFDDPGVSSELEKFILSHDSLKPGDQLEGKVIQIKPNDKVLIHFGKFRAVAQATFPIKEGEIIRVKVVSKWPKLKLSLETPQLKISPGTRQVISKLEMVPEDRWSHLRTILEKLLDLEGEAFFPPGIREALAESEKNVKFKIFSHSPLGLSLLLFTPHFQQIRTDFFYLKKGDLNITFFVKSQRVKEQLESQVSGVRQNLAQRFQHLVLEVIVSERKISEFDTEDMEASLVDKKMLDVKA